MESLAKNRGPATGLNYALAHIWLGWLVCMAIQGRERTISATEQVFTYVAR